MFVRRSFLTFALLAGLLGPLLALSWYSYDKQRQTLEGSFRFEMNQIVQTLANGMTNPIWNLIPESGQPIIDSVMSDPRIMSVDVTSDGQGVFLSARRDSAPSGRTETVGHSVEYRGQPIGRVVAAIDTTTMYSELDAQWRRIVIASVVQSAFIIAIVAFVVWMNGRIQREAMLREAQKEIARVEARFISALDNLPDTIALFDPDEKLVICNQRYKQISDQNTGRVRSGMTFEEILRIRLEFGRMPTTAIGRENDWIKDRLKWFRSAPFIRETKAGDQYFQVRDDKLVDGSTICIATNVTELKRRDEALLQAQKIEAIGQLTGGIAHDFNNLLAIILGNSELLGEKLKDPEADRMAQTIIATSKRGAAMTRQLLAFGRRASLRPELIDINGVLTEQVALLKRTMPSSIDVELSLTENLWHAHADRAQLETAIINLAINARDAMPDGGKLTIGTANVRLDEAFGGSPDIQPEAGSYVMIAVSDSGVGMPAAVADQAFEPYFTTKGVGAGTGLGLSMVHGFIKQSGGQANIFSEPGRGTTVKLFLPKADEDLSAAIIPAPSTLKQSVPRSIGGEKILVVEDDVDVRKTVASQLMQLGYEVVEAQDGPTGLDILRVDTSIDLLLSDVIMPGGLSGPKVVEAARAERPDIKVLLMSGYPNDVVTGASGIGGKDILIGKPIERAELARVVRNVLDG